MTMRLIITGAAGFMGSHLSRYFLERGYSVMGLDDFSGGYPEWLPSHPNFYFREIDLCTHTDVISVCRSFEPDCILHFAAYAAEGLSPFIRCFNYQNNIVASAALINAAIEADSRFVYASSMAIYGDMPTPFTESTPPKPVDPYGIAKLAVEQDLQVAAEQHGLRYSVIRPHNVIGIRQNIWDRYRNVLGIFVRQALNAEDLTVFGDGFQQRAFSDVNDLLQPIEHLATGHVTGIYNLGGNQPVTVKTLAEMVVAEARNSGLSPSIVYLPSRHEVMDAFSDHSAAERDLAFRDTLDLELMVAQVFRWATSEKPRAIRSMHYEITKGLPNSWTT